MIFAVAHGILTSVKDARGARADAAQRRWLIQLARRWATEQDAEDLAHDAWLAGSESRSGADARWWSGVVRNRWKMGIRAAVRRRAREGALEQADESQMLGPERISAQKRIAKALEDCLQTLDPVDRDIVILRHGEGWNAAEIGRELSLEPATVRTRLRRALLRMRSALEERWGTEEKPWQWAVLPAAAPASAPASAATLLAASWVKWMLAAASVVTVGSIAVTAFRTADVPPTVEPTDSNESSTDRWARHRDSLRWARRARLKGPARWFREPDEVDEAADALAGLFFEEAAVSSKALLRMLGRQVADSLRECAEQREVDAGVLTVRAQLIAEPDVGTIVESVDVVEDTVGDPDLLECVRESSYTYDFPDPEASLYLAHDFTVNVDEKQVAAAAVLPLDRLPEVLERYPAYLDALPAVLEQIPAIAEPMRKLVDRDPSLRHRLPRFVELIGAGETGG